MPVAIDGGIVVQLGARRRRKEWQQSVGTEFDGVFYFRGVRVDVGIFWNDGASHGAWVVGDKRCCGQVGQSDGEVLLRWARERERWGGWGGSVGVVGQGGAGATRRTRTAAKINVEEGNCGIEMAKEDSSDVDEEQHTIENGAYPEPNATEPNVANTTSGRDSKQP